MALPPKKDLWFIDAHHGVVTNRASYCPDSRRIVSAGSDGTAVVWDSETGKLLAILRGHTKAVMSAEWSRDGTWIATASYDGFVIIWNGKKYTKVSRHNMNPTRKTTNVGYVGPERKAAIAAAGKLNYLAWDSSSTLLAVCKSDSRAVILDRRSGRSWTLDGHAGPVWCAAWQPGDDAVLATASDDRTVIIWDARESARAPRRRLEDHHTSFVNTVAWSWNGQRLVSGSSDKTMVVWDTLSWTVISVLKHHSMSVYNVAFSPCRTYLVSGSSDGSIAVWDGFSFELLEARGLGEARVMTVACGRGGCIAAARCDGTVAMWRSGAAAEKAMPEVDNGASFVDWVGDVQGSFLSEFVDESSADDSEDLLVRLPKRPRTA